MPDRRFDPLNRLFVAALLVVLAAGTAGANPCDEGDEAFDRGDIPGAIAAYDGCLERGGLDDWDLAQVLHARGFVRMASGDLIGALADMDRAIAEGDASGATLSDRGMVLLMMGRPEEAIAQFDRAAERDPSFAPIYLNRGGARLELNDTAGAFADFSLAIETDPAMPMPYFHRARLLVAAGEFDRALTDLDAFLALRHDIAEAYNTRGFVLDQLGRGAEAREDYDRALAIDPGLILALNNRGYQSYLAGDYASAVDDLSAALEADQVNPQRYVNLALALIKLRGSAGRALEIADMGLGLAPDAANLHDLRGQALAALGRTEEAVAAHERAIELAGSELVLAYQKQLAAYGYGNVTSSGRYDAATRGALVACIREACDLWPR